MTITTEHSRRGGAAGNRTFEKACRDCGAPFVAKISHAERMVRCPACQQAHNYAKKRAYQEKDFEISIGGPYKLIYDPDDSWCVGSSFKRHEIRDMLRLFFLVEGTRFTRDGAVYEIRGGKMEPLT